MRLPSLPAHLGIGDSHVIELVEAYSKAQTLFRTDETPDRFSAIRWNSTFHRSSSMAGPKRPQDRLTLGQVKKNFSDCLCEATSRSAQFTIRGENACYIGVRWSSRRYQLHEHVESVCHGGRGYSGEKAARRAEI